MKKKAFVERPLKVKKNGIFLYVISPLVPEIFKIFVLCKLGTDDVIRCDNMDDRYLSVAPYKALEKFSKALYGTTGDTYSARVFRPVMISLQVMMQNNWNLASTLYTKKYAT